MSFILCLLFCGGFVFSQSFFTNTVGQVDAISLASRLRVGMREEDASRFLETNKLHLTLRAGAAVGWDSVYILTNGCSLHLDYTAREIAKNGHWGGNGLLRRAFIQSNSVDIISITFTNAP